MLGPHLERQFLVSGDALERLADLEGFAREDLGLLQLRGRAAAMQVYAVTARPSTNESPLAQKPNRGA